MTAELTRVHPLQAWTDRFERLPASVTIRPEPFVAMVDVQLDGAGPDVEAALGVTLPRTPGSWLPAPSGRVVWLGPGEWLLSSTVHEPWTLEEQVREVLVPLGGSAADVSAQRIGLRLTGDRAREVLARGCAIDLHPRVFGAGRGAQTTLALAGVVLLSLSDTGDDFLVLVRSSFAGYLAEWLLDAALEFTAG